MCNIVCIWYVYGMCVCVRVCMCTCKVYEHLIIVVKDFALDPDETRMRIAAHHIVRNLTAGMAMITSREPLLLAINSSLKSSMSGFIRVSSVFHLIIYISIKYNCKCSIQYITVWKTSFINVGSISHLFQNIVL